MRKRKKRTAREVEKWFQKKSQRPTRFIYRSKAGSVIYMKSSWEVRYANWLDSQKLKWYYEPLAVPTGYGHYYFPDFFLPKLNEWHEVKGRVTKTAACKMEAFRKLYPDTTLKIIGAKEMKDVP